MKFLNFITLALASTGFAQETVADPNSRFAPIPGPKIISTETSVAEQRNSKTRPKFHQPLQLTETASPVTLPLTPAKGESIVFIGNSLAERMTFYNHFEPLLFGSFPEHDLTFRNMGFPGHTPAFRPEAGNPNPWAFPDAKKYRPDIKNHFGKGHYPMPDEWLTILQADTIVAFFGFNESYSGMEGLPLFKEELSAFVDHTLKQGYNYKKAPRLVLATPIHTEQNSGHFDPDERNQLLAAYTNVIREVAAAKKVGLLNLFTPTKGWSGHTINGVHTNDTGNQKLAPLIAKGLFGKAVAPKEGVAEAIDERNWFWQNDYRIPNGVHVYGQRWAPYGNVNYPEEIEKVRQMTVLSDQKIWTVAKGEKWDAPDFNSETRTLSTVTTNYKPSAKNGALDYLDSVEAAKKIKTPEGYEVTAFASEKEFPNLANPMQMRFDNKGRLWVAAMPSYPHYRPGDPKPADKILIYEDTNGDGKADKEIVWADDLSIPIGFDFAPGGGIYLAESSRLNLLRDTDGDDKYDSREYLLDGFDPHDSHHAISAFTVDHGGGVFMLEGRFLHSQVETPYGPQRMTDGGMWRFDPHTWAVERVFQSDVSNPWGVVEDEYGQNILNDASGGAHYWVAGHGVKVPHSMEVPHVAKFNYEHSIRPTSGSEFIHSRHFPEEVQGDYIYANTIGFLGIKQLQVEEIAEEEIRGRFRHNLIESSDGNFRPADLEFAPDGSLYFVDWHNALIGHMQHSARDPNRDSVRGRIYRITYSGRDLVDPPKIAGASLEELFENMKLPELQARKRSHREIRGHDSEKVHVAAMKFAKENADDERLVLEALWATWGVNGYPNKDMLRKCLAAKDFKVRSAAVRVLRHTFNRFDDAEKMLLRTAKDPNARVRLETLTVASWMGGEKGARILLTVASQPHTKWINNSLNAAMWLLKPEVEKELEKGSYEIEDRELFLASKLKAVEKEKDYLTKSQRKLHKQDKEFRMVYNNGKKFFMKEGSCSTCHQENGLGLEKIYPPLAGSEWVTGDTNRLTKLTLHGLMGPITVKGVKYDGLVPMTAVGQMYNDKQVAAMLTYVRNSWGNVGSVITPDEVAKVRAETKDRKIFYKPEELLEEHPFPSKGEK